MANSSRLLYQSFIKKGISKEDAFFAVLDHFNELHWHDQNAYDVRIKQLETRVLELEQGRP